MLDFCVAIQH